MYLTGFADEAATDLNGQIRVTKELGWNKIESRAIDGQNIHDLSDEQFDAVYRKVCDAGIEINCFGSLSPTGESRWISHLIRPSKR